MEINMCLISSFIDWRSTLIKMVTTKKLCAAYDDLDHFASIQFHSVACLHTYGRFLESFLVAQYNPFVRFGLACRSDARDSYNWPALNMRLSVMLNVVEKRMFGSGETLGFLHVKHT